MRTRRRGISPERADAAMKIMTRVWENNLRDSHSIPKLEDPIDMITGDKRKITEPSQVPKVLMLDKRDWPRRPGVLSVSVLGLWGCTSSMSDVATWFAGKAKSFRMVEGVDWIGESTGECLALFVGVTRARQMIADADTNAGNAARGALDAAIEVDRLLAKASAAGVNLKLVPTELVEPASKPVEVAAEPVPPAAASPEPEPGPVPGASEEPDEPWAEAFDFGRLVPVSEREIGGVLQPTVSARDVHTFLAAGRRPTTWFQEQVRRCALVEGVDWQRFNSPKDGRVSARGPLPDEMALTLPAAKKVAMAASGSRGAAVREYFIECERRLLAGEGPIPGTVAPASIPASAGRRSTEYRTVAIDVRPSQMSMPDRFVPLTMADFLVLLGFGRSAARALATEHGPTLLRQMMLDGEGANVCRHPVSRKVSFARPALDAWWESSGIRLLPAPQIPV